jgi:hypothetical protein
MHLSSEAGTVRPGDPELIVRRLCPDRKLVVASQCQSGAVSAGDREHRALLVVRIYPCED